MAAYANLTEAERERLEVLIEECGEVITIATKVLRHGYDHYHPEDKTKTRNVYALEKEITDVMTIVHRMEAVGDLDIGLPDHNARWKKKLRWMRHQGGEE